MAQLLKPDMAAVLERTHLAATSTPSYFPSTKPAPTQSTPYSIDMEAPRSRRRES